MRTQAHTQSTCSTVQQVVHQNKCKKNSIRQVVHLNVPAGSTTRCGTPVSATSWYRTLYQIHFYLACIRCHFFNYILYKYTHTHTHTHNFHISKVVFCGIFPVVTFILLFSFTDSGKFNNSNNNTPLTQHGDVYA